MIEESYFVMVWKDGRSNPVLTFWQGGELEADGYFFKSRIGKGETKYLCKIVKSEDGKKEADK
jgi:hypothetical protein